ncbi:hypothetical protein R5R35_012158 [Gryllus longicercus]|uniref:G-protein coupled receptors family 2 profile 2 domain-containing protein n=1 Tax=Gryllus longicercus TaxID=2509291 RepID=A0AAN9VZY1_9ORTH
MSRAPAAALLLLLLRAASGVAEAPAGDEAPPAAPGPTLLRKCCGAREQLSAAMDACVAYEGAAGETRAAWEGAGAVRRRAGDGFPWWLHAATPLYDAQTGNATARPLLRAQPPDAVLRYGPAPPCPRSAYKYFTWNSFSRYRLLSNGTLLLRTDDLPSTATPNLPLPPDLYCVDRIDMAGDMHVFYTCPCNKTVCVNKCCPLKQELSVSVFRKHNSFNCVSSTERWKPKFLSSNDSNDTVNVQHVVLYPVIPSCTDDEEKVLLNSRPGDAPSALRVLANGSAVLEGFGRGRAFAAQRWCGDFSGVGGNASRAPNALACLRKSARPLEAGTVYGSLFLVGAFFLVLTLLVYALLPEMRRSAHAKALLCHVAALLAGSLALAWGQLRTIRTKGECYFIGFFIEYWMLATFFWLTAVCIEIARTFSQMLPANMRGASEQSKFLWYSLYAWGGPAVITAVAIALEFAEGLPDHIVRPDLGKTSCFLGCERSPFAAFCRSSEEHCRSRI